MKKSRKKKRMSADKEMRSLKKALIGVFEQHGRDFREWRTNDLYVCHNVARGFRRNPYGFISTEEIMARLGSIESELMRRMRENNEHN